MTEPAILRKLRQALAQDISTEGQVVYILVEVRKLIKELTSRGNMKLSTFTVLGQSTPK